MLSPNVQPSEYLPGISSRVETVRLLYGSMIRLCIHSTAYYGSKGLISELVFGNKGALDICERHAICYVFSMAAETGVSVLWMPVRYLAAVNTPRFLLDYLLTSWSEALRFIDGFNPGRYAAFALYAFASDMDAEWNLDFFAWQIPSIVLTVGKLIMRRARVGAKRCRTKRILGVLFLQILLRAYMSTFSVMVPEESSEAFEAMLVTMLEVLCTTYLVRHTWPFPFEDITADHSSGCSEATTQAAVGTRSNSSDEVCQHPSEAASRPGALYQLTSVAERARPMPSVDKVDLD